MKHKWRDFFKRRAAIPTGSKFIVKSKVTKHRLLNSSDPVLVWTFEADEVTYKFAMHQGLAWQMVREIRKGIGFSESELEAAQWISRYGGGGV